MNYVFFQADKNQSVFLTLSQKRYHNINCRSKGYGKITSLLEANKKGALPCYKCRPPNLRVNFWDLKLERTIIFGAGSAFLFYTLTTIFFMRRRKKRFKMLRKCGICKGSGIISSLWGKRIFVFITAFTLTCAGLISYYLSRLYNIFTIQWDSPNSIGILIFFVISTLLIPLLMEIEFLCSTDCENCLGTGRINN